MAIFDGSRIPPRRMPPLARVLVGEDDHAMRALVDETLSRSGYEVLAVADGASLLVELARQGHFHYRHVDLVLTDVRMPLCSGLDVLDAFPAARVRPRFILMTAFPDDALVARATEMGVALLGKPFGMARLCQLVEHELAEA